MSISKKRIQMMKDQKCIHIKKRNMANKVHPKKREIRKHLLQ